MTQRTVNDILLGLFVVAIAVMLLVPLPTPLMDFLLACNIGVSIVLLLVGLYIPDAVALLSFPSLLLLTTLFRLSLNVATTRLILTQADAGHIIEAFGSFLIRGEVIVGLVIFAIITAVNLVVIARGSVRISEVAARFALDSLPGKLVSIDSDLRAGLISPSEAEKRREELRRESQLYGAMDGAMKFVQGDAIAGIFIIFTNIIGGIYLGIQHGMSFAEAIHTYTILTVGDGLVSQIPAILIAICAGIVVTRISSTREATLANELGAQLFQRPSTLLFAGILIAAFGTISGFPAWAFLSIGASLMLLSYWTARKETKAAAPYPQSKLLSLSPSLSSFPLLGAATQPSLPSVQQVPSLSEGQTVVIQLDSTVLSALYKEEAEHLRLNWQRKRQSIREELGIILPEINFTVNNELKPCRYRIIMSRWDTIEGELQTDVIGTALHPAQALALGLSVVKEETFPYYGYKVVWCANSQRNRWLCQAANIYYWPSLEWLLYVVLGRCLEYPEEYISLSYVYQMVKELEKQYPDMMDEIFGKGYITTTRVYEIVLSLVKEGVNVNNFRKIMELIGGYCGSVGAELVRDEEFNLEDIVGYIRLKMAREIVSKNFVGLNKIRALKLSNRLEQELINNSFGAGDIESTMVKGIRSYSESVRAHGKGALSVIVPNELRSKCQKIIGKKLKGTAVFSIEETEDVVGCEYAGMVEV